MKECKDRSPGEEALKEVRENGCRVLNMGGPWQVKEATIGCKQKL